MVVSDSETKFVDKAGLDHAINELKAYIDSISTGDIDLSDYVTQEQLQSALDALDIDIDLSAYATKEELQLLPKRAILLQLLLQIKTELQRLLYLTAKMVLVVVPGVAEMCIQQKKLPLVHGLMGKQYTERPLY